MPAVNVQVVVTPKMLREFKGLSDDAIQRAISMVLSMVPAIAQRYVPESTGRLLHSLETGQTPRSIVFKFSALDPVYGYDYAKVVEEGRAGGKILTPKRAKAMRFEYPYKSGNIVFAKRVKQGAMAGRYYAEAIRNDVRQALIDALAWEYEMMRL